MNARSKSRRFSTPAVAAEVLDSRLLLSAQFAPQGAFDGITSAHAVHGWALDLDVPEQPMRVHIYIDGQHVGTTTTGIARPDVNRATGVAGRHGFQWQIPDEFLDGAAHTVDVFGIDPQGVKNTKLSNSGRRLGTEIEVTGVTDGQSASVSLGSVNQFGRLPEKTFTIKNTGNVALTLSQFGLITSRQTTSFEVTKEPSSTILPGQSTQFKVRLTRTDFSGDFTARVQFSTNDSDESTFDFPITATVRRLEPEVSVDGITDGQASAVNLGSVNQGSSVPSKTFTIRNTGRGPLSIGELTLSNPAFEVTRQPSTSITPNGSTTFTVALRGTATAGTFNSTLSFTTNDADERTFDFQITATVKARLPEISVVGVTDGQSAAVNLGTVNQNASAPTKTFTIQNTGVGTLTLGEVVVNNSAFQVTRQPSASVAPNGATAFTISLRNTAAAGTFSGTVSFTTNDADEATFNFPVSATVRSTQPEIEVSIDGKVVAPGSNGLLDFRAVSQGSGKTETILIRNTGTKPLTLSSYEVSSTQTLFNRPTTIQPGKSASLQVSFRWDTLGLREGTIRFRTNDADEPIIQIDTRGKVFDVASQTLGVFPISVTSGTHRVSFTQPVRIEIEPPSGQVAFGTAYIIRTTDLTGRPISVLALDSGLRQLEVTAPAGTIIEDWTDRITVVRHQDGAAPRSVDAAFADVTSLLTSLN